MKGKPQQQQTLLSHQAKAKDEKGPESWKKNFPLLVFFFLKHTLKDSPFCLYIHEKERRKNGRVGALLVTVQSYEKEHCAQPHGNSRRLGPMAQLARSFGLLLSKQMGIDEHPLLSVFLKPQCLTDLFNILMPINGNRS